MVYAALLLLAVCLPPCPAEAATLATGMNIANPMRANEAARTALIGHVAAGVHVVHCGITDDAAGIALPKRSVRRA